jgi:hypothetical protein
MFFLANSHLLYYQRRKNGDTHKLQLIKVVVKSRKCRDLSGWTYPAFPGTLCSVEIIAKPVSLTIPANVQNAG